MKVYKRQVKSGEIHKYPYFICGSKSEDYYNCSNGRIGASILEPIVEQEIKKECSKIVFSKKELDSLYEQAKQNSNSKKTRLMKEITKKEKEIQQTEKKIEQIYTDKIEGLIKPEDFTRFYESYQEKKEKIIVQMNTLKQELNEAQKEKVVSYDHIRKIANECLKVDCLNEEILGKLVERIEYNGKNIKIKYKFMEQ